ncbi:MAG: hypothetical protein U1C04_00235, partial [Hydrogenophaga sp.]|nr:hypothetical protein [Hydrogenophaga sp.]
MKSQYPVNPMLPPSHPTRLVARTGRRAWLRQLMVWSSLLLAGLAWLGWPQDAHAIRIKEIAAVQGVR